MDYPLKIMVNIGTIDYVEGSEGVLKRFKPALDVWDWIVHGNNVGP